MILELGLFICLVLAISLMAFSLIERVSTFKRMRLTRLLIDAETSAKRQLEKYYRARTWAVIVTAKGDRSFTAEEIAEEPWGDVPFAATLNQLDLGLIDAMGLGDLLKDDERETIER
jgi:hypothetical protein